MHNNAVKGGSYTWKSMLKAKETLRHGFNQELGDGRRSFWFENWLDVSPLCTQVLLMVNFQDVEFYVKDVYAEHEYYPHVSTITDTVG